MVGGWLGAGDIHLLEFVAGLTFEVSIWFIASEASNRIPLTCKASCEAVNPLTSPSVLCCMCG
jgi:hypothetical protein